MCVNELEAFMDTPNTILLHQHKPAEWVCSRMRSAAITVWRVQCPSSARGKQAFLTLIYTFGVHNLIWTAGTVL